MDLAIATVERATNVSCLVRLVGDSRLTEAHYSKMIQSNFIVIQPRHVVVVDRAQTPAQVVWRAGTVATVVEVDGARIAYKVGDAGGPLRATNTVALVDLRPEDERRGALERGDEVIIGRGPEKGVPAILDSAVDGRPVHPERFEVEFAQIEARAQTAG